MVYLVYGDVRVVPIMDGVIVRESKLGFGTFWDVKYYELMMNK